MTTSIEPPVAKDIAWEHDWETAIGRARSERKLLLIDVERDQ